MNTIDATDARLTTHEEICSLRYEKINESLQKGELRMTKLEYLIYAVLVVVLLGPGVGAEFFKKLLGI